MGGCSTTIEAELGHHNTSVGSTASIVRLFINIIKKLLMLIIDRQVYCNGVS